MGMDDSALVQDLFWQRNTSSSLVATCGGCIHEHSPRAYWEQVHPVIRMVSPLPTIVTLAQAKKAARIDPGSFEEDGDLYLRLEIAHELVLDYVNNRLEDADDWTDTIINWDADTAPRAVKAGILAMFTYLTRFRGDDAEKDHPELPDGDLPPRVRMFLKRLRDPTVQ